MQAHWVFFRTRITRSRDAAGCGSWQLPISLTMIMRPVCSWRSADGVPSVVKWQTLRPSHWQHMHCAVPPEHPAHLDPPPRFPSRLHRAAMKRRETVAILYPSSILAVPDAIVRRADWGVSSQFRGSAGGVADGGDVLCGGRDGAECKDVDGRTDWREERRGEGDRSCRHRIFLGIASKRPCAEAFAAMWGHFGSKKWPPSLLDILKYRHIEVALVLNDYRSGSLTRIMCFVINNQSVIDLCSYFHTQRCRSALRRLANTQLFAVFFLLFLFSTYPKYLEWFSISNWYIATRMNKSVRLNEQFR